jgi:hypothetical protein
MVEDWIALIGNMNGAGAGGGGTGSGQNTPPHVTAGARS